ncbi:hypothetical protein BCR42DRAFT_390462 [Absidia repens]|uniref:Uncharacterized protein n=1 Tax=Absidia repens TaxID=90262 RepID=A0A1X2IP93_9FUNG|nr:hypothetical protein BCR42DRAFT_390462 [Absidia repens]
MLELPCTDFMNMTDVESYWWMNIAEIEASEMAVDVLSLLIAIKNASAYLRNCCHDYLKRKKLVVLAEFHATLTIDHVPTIGIASASNLRYGWITGTVIHEEWWKETIGPSTNTATHINAAVTTPPRNDGTGWKPCPKRSQAISSLLEGLCSRSAIEFRTVKLAEKTERYQNPQQQRSSMVIHGKAIPVWSSVV